MKNHHPLTKLAACLLIAFFAVLPATSDASDLTGGYAWTPTDRVTSTKLNNSVGAATINTTFYTDKTVAQPVTADTFLFYSAASAVYKKTTLATLLLSNTNLIVGATEKTTPATNDQVLILDVSANTFKKATLNSLTWTNDALINARTNWATPNSATTYVLGYDSGAWFKLNISNIFYNYANFAWFTNLAANVTPTNVTQVMTYDPITGTNRSLTLAGMITNAPTATTNAPGDFLYGYSTNDSKTVKWQMNQLWKSYTSATFPVPNANTATTNTHSLPGKPQIVRVAIICTNAAGDGTYVLNDEVDVSTVKIASSGTPYHVAYDATKIYLAYRDGIAGWTVGGKDAAGLTITKTAWNVKIYAYYLNW